MTILVLALAFVLGAVLWSFMEYVLHRFAFHERRGRNYGSRVHLQHHARREYSFKRVWLPWLGVLIVGFAVLTPLVAVLVGASVGFAFGLGYVVGYFYYEWVHAAAHLWAPRTSYGRWLRKHHFTHHFGAPLENQGVTTPVWDMLFGTRVRADKVVVPRRLAMRWLTDDEGRVLPEFAGDYEVRGHRRMTFEQECEVAFANQAPRL